MSKNIIKHNYQVSRTDRERKNGHKSFLLWFTGLSGSGKSTIANKVEEELHKKGVKTYVLDGDNIRNGINNDLTFISKDRFENIRRVGEIANLMLDAGVVTLAAFISPFSKDRSMVKEIVKTENYVEIFINTSLSECERRDVKGLYAKARSGEINNMTGISAPFEIPVKPDIEIRTEELSVDKAVIEIMNYIKPKLNLRNE